ncbi:MAG: LysM peptidoglycan-binding domain-containing protein [Haliea sp.]|jgi:membrane-bound lytic murein transglycosylase D|nr:LysM peptidoglycan-binding domain-containing protein [Haliea sp.]
MAPEDTAENARPVAVISTPVPGKREGLENRSVRLPHANPDDLWGRIQHGMQWQLPENAQVDDARDYYLRQKGSLKGVLAERGSLYLHYIVEEVERRELPLELALLPLVESQLNPFAVSSQQAVGVWQIIPTTGETLGVTNNWWFDGRRDLRDSTRAALDYLEYLHATLGGDWLNAIAAYNGGVGRVSRAMASNDAKGRPTDFWSLPLPKETRNYVPRLLALSSLIAEPERFDMDLPPLRNHPAFVAVPTGGQLELARAAQLAGMSKANLHALNPGHLRWATAPQASELLLPPERAHAFTQQLAVLDDDHRVRWEHYEVRRGDTLSKIARVFSTRVELLREANKLQSNFIREGATLMIPRGGDWETSLASRESAPGPKAKDYKVRPGDSLYRIAGRFKVRVEDIIAWNALNARSPIFPGQQLTLYVRGG